MKKAQLSIMSNLISAQKWGCLFSALLITGFSLTFAGQVNAATLTVGSGIDCNHSSIRLAIFASSSGDKIQVTNETFLANAAVLNIENKTLIIEGGHTNCSLLSNISGYTTLDGTGMFPDDSIIEITDSVGGMNVELRNLQIQFGLTDFGGGGGVEISGKASASLAQRIDATLRNVFVRLNLSDNGGGIHATDADVLITDGSLIKTNRANEDGGGVFCQNGQLTLSKDSYIGDTGILQGNSSGSDGGGVFLDNCDLTLDSSDGSTGAFIKGNSTVNAGGGISAQDSDVTIDIDTFVSSNITDSNGGGVSILGTGNLNVSGTISKNQAGSGGGIRALGAAEIILNSSAIISQNTANSGAGISISDTDIRISGQILSNTASSRGGGITASNSTIYLQANGQISQNISDDDGGGIRFSGDSTLNMGSETEISGNFAPNGAGIYMSFSFDPTQIQKLSVFGGHISNNIAATRGGGLYIRSSRENHMVRLDGVQIKANEAQTGAGIYYESSSGGGTLFIGNSNIDDNIASVHGGGMYATGRQASSAISLSIATFRNNSAFVDGGGIYLKGATALTSVFSLIADNSAEKGGGLYLLAGSEDGSPPIVTLESKTNIRNNQAGFGAGVYLKGAENRPVDFSIEDGIMDSNIAATTGGAFYSRQAFITMKRVSLFNNAGASAALLDAAFSETFILTILSYLNPGPALFNIGQDSNFVLWESTLVGEPGISLFAPTHSLANLLVENSILSRFDSTFNGSGDLTSNCMLDSTGQMGAPDAAAFVDVASDDFHLLPSSPAINKCARGVNLDLDSNPRPVGTSSTPYDIGAFEYQTPLTSYLLSVSVQGNGKISSRPGSIECGIACSEEFVENTSVTLFASADPGFVFDSWSGACTGASSCTVLVTEVKSVEALFVIAEEVIFQNSLE